jgi:Ankyrin repeats (3 copies)/Phytanoyl-CoA dioxygenase (PhyH)
MSINSGVTRKLRNIFRYAQSHWAATVSFRSVHGGTTLMALVKSGDTPAIVSLLKEGADVNEQDSRGRTALHYAVKCGQPQAAACLLAYGADHTIQDKQGNRPLSLEYTNVELLHALRQRYRRFIRSGGVSESETTEAVVHWLENLKQNGIVRISGLIRPDELVEMQREFDVFVKNLDNKMAAGDADFKHYDEEEHWWPKDHAYITNNAFKYSQQLIRFCCNPKLLEIARRFYGRDALIQRGVGMRYLSCERTDNNMFRWHHDMEEKRLKVMVLLTDVGEDDQCMSYALGTQKIFHPYRMFFSNACSLEYAGRHVDEIKIYDAVGKAGDVILFDTNGAHRGNRRPDAKVRDAFFVEFTTDTSNIWGGDIPANFFIDNPVSGANPFANMMSVPKKWDLPITRINPTWVTNLPYPERWLIKTDSS